MCRRPTVSTAGLVMQEHIVSDRESEEARYNPRFLEFVQAFACIDNHDKLFPKTCRTCGRTFGSLARYLEGTVAKGHSLEDCEETMRAPYTMTYRHCSCGNTLVLTFTADTYPLLRKLWGVLREEAASAGKPLKEVVTDFSVQWEHYILTHCPTKE